jgi:hypothetical protein
MVSTEELKFAKSAKGAVKALLTATSKQAALATLKEAYRAAVLNLSSGGGLNAARAKVVIALSARSADEREDQRGHVSNRRLDNGIGDSLYGDYYARAKFIRDDHSSANGPARAGGQNPAQAPCCDSRSSWRGWTAAQGLVEAH